MWLETKGGLQLGGSDQWGNITAGIDYIHKKRSVTESADSEQESQAFGITIPLLTTSTGEKFGKSAGNAVWLDETMTSIFDFYQVSSSREGTYFNRNSSC